MKLLDLIRRNKKVRCYPYCIGLKYDRTLERTKNQWEKTDINVIAEIILEDIEKLKITAKIVDNKYIPSGKENLLAIRACIMWQGGDYLHDVDYHIVVKKQDGYWYSKFEGTNPEKLPLGTNIESWNWRDSNKEVPRKYYNSEIAYIAVKF